MYSRFELPTDDEAYEALRKFKSREKQREYELESLHNSMFGWTQMDDQTTL